MSSKNYLRAQMAGPSTIVDDYGHSFVAYAPRTVAEHQRTLERFLAWLTTTSARGGAFSPALLTSEAIEAYLSTINATAYSASHKARHASVLRRFARWLVAQHLIATDPSEAIAPTSRYELIPSPLAVAQRALLRSLVGRLQDPRSTALFALGYWAGCRSEEIPWITLDHLELRSVPGWLHVGTRSGVPRTIPLHRHARQALAQYLQVRPPSRTADFVFLHGVGRRLAHDEVDQWFEQLKHLLEPETAPLLQAVRFNDLRRDFAHRAAMAQWTHEEIATYIGARQGRREASGAHRAPAHDTSPDALYHKPKHVAE